MRPSPPSRAAWIEIAVWCCLGMRPASPPSRAAWIEICLFHFDNPFKVSPPSRAAWIEIQGEEAYDEVMRRRRLHGRRGLKYTLGFPIFIIRGRRLHGRRGLKYHGFGLECAQHRRRLHGRRGLKLRYAQKLEQKETSPPSRAAWIEIRYMTFG